MNRAKYTTIPIATLIQPKNGIQHVYVDYYWLVNEEDEVLIYNAGSAQCNPNCELVEKIKPAIERSYGASLTIKHIPLAFVPQYGNVWRS